MSTDNLRLEEDPPEVSKDQLIHDFKVMVADAEALLKATAGHSGEAMASVRARMEESLAAAKVRMAAAEEAMLERAKVAARATDKYVHENPWKAIGVAAGIGLVVGLLIGRR